MAECAAPDDIDCGTTHQASDSRERLQEARACVENALATDQPFRVLIDLEAADATAFNGWVYDGTTYRQFQYNGDGDDALWTPCKRLGDYGTDHGLGYDLGYWCIWIGSAL
jgi:hypothetical protein